MLMYCEYKSVNNGCEKSIKRNVEIIADMNSEQYTVISKAAAFLWSIQHFKTGFSWNTVCFDVCKIFKLNVDDCLLWCNYCKCFKNKC